VTIIDIQPNAELLVSLPNEQYPADSMWLRPGQRRSYLIPAINPPVGMETLKLLMSRQPLDLQTLLQTRGRRTTSRTPANPLLLLLGSRLRNSSQQTIRVEEAGLATYLFWIDKPTP
jgi:metacaspase-1